MRFGKQMKQFPNQIMFLVRKQAMPGEKLIKTGDLDKSIKTERLRMVRGYMADLQML